MPHYKVLFPSRYVGAFDLKGDTVVTIRSIKIKTLDLEGGVKEDKPLVSFYNAKKQWVLNKTNAKIIAKLYGNDTDDWIGKSITLYPTTCDAFGDVVDCIRVRKTTPKYVYINKKDQNPYMGEIMPEDEYTNGEVPPDQEPTDEELGQ